MVEELLINSNDTGVSSPRLIPTIKGRIDEIECRHQFHFAVNPSNFVQNESLRRNCRECNASDWVPPVLRWSVTSSLVSKCPFRRLKKIFGHFFPSRFHHLFHSYPEPCATMRITAYVWLITWINSGWYHLGANQIKKKERYHFFKLKLNVSNEDACWSAGWSAS